MTGRDEDRSPSGTDRDADRAPSASDRDEGISTLARQGTITFVGNVVNGLLGFAIVMVITRFVSPSIYGLFVLATSVILFMQVFANLGLPLAIDYFVPQYLAEGERGRATGVIVQVTATVLVTSSLVAFALALGSARMAAFFGEPSLRVALLGLSVALPMLAIYKVLLTSYYSIKRLQYRVIMRDLVRPIVRFSATVGLLFAGFGLLALLGGYVVGLFVAIVVGAAIFLYRARPFLTVDVEFVPTKPLVAYSVPLAMTSVIYVFMGRVDYFVLGFFLPADDVGVYRIGFMFGDALLIVFSSLAPVFKPLIAESREDAALVERRFRVAARWIFGLTLPIAIVLSLGAASYLSVFYTPQYAEASAVVALLSAAFLVNATLGGPDGTLLQGLGYSRLVFANTLVLFGSNVAVSFALVPVYGIEGAAFGSATALVLVGLLTLAELHYLEGIHPFSRAFGKVAFAGVPAAAAGGAVVRSLSSPTAIAAVLPVVVLAVYALVLVATDAFTEEDRRLAGQFGPAVDDWLPARLLNLVPSGLLRR